MALKEKNHFDFQPLKLCTDKLPKIENIISAVNYEREKNKKKNEEAIDNVAREVVGIWNKISVPVLNIKTVFDKIKRLYQEYSTIVNHLSGPKHMALYKTKYKMFKVYINCCVFVKYNS